MKILQLIILFLLLSGISFAEETNHPIYGVWLQEKPEDKQVIITFLKDGSGSMKFFKKSKRVASSDFKFTYTSNELKIMKVNITETLVYNWKVEANTLTVKLQGYKDRVAVLKRQLLEPQK